jgi:hypothetical protein
MLPHVGASTLPRAETRTSTSREGNSPLDGSPRWMCDGEGVGHQHPWGDSGPMNQVSGEAMVGKLIAGGKYQIVRVLGEGGMGAVYKALQPAMKRMVALKLIRPEMVTKPDAVARFHKEMMVTARVEHPNTIRVYDFGNDNGQLYLAMEFLAGASLHQAIDSAGQLDVARLVRIGTQVANALGAIHGHGIVHRDLKPDNVMLLDSFGERDFVKVLDFGIAKVLDEQVRLTATGKPIGTPTYMAPEQAMGLAVDARTDLYALGVMLYRMASGRLPFDAPMTGSMLLAHAHEIPTPILTVVPDLPPTLATLIMQLLEKDPDARPASAAEVVARLSSLRGAGRRQPMTPRARWLAALAAVVVTVAVGAYAVVLRPADRGETAATSDAPVVPAGGITSAGDAVKRHELDELLQRARAHAAQGHHEEALADVEEAVQRQPDSAEAWAMLGELRERLQRGDAQAAYCRAKQLGDARAAERCKS